MILSAADLCRTRLCRARDCDRDAETYSLLCASCERKRANGRHVALHENPPQLEPQLYCHGCRTWLPDETFGERQPNSSGYSPTRRGRRSECHPCEAKRRRECRKRHAS